MPFISLVNNLLKVKYFFEKLKYKKIIFISNKYKYGMDELKLRFRTRLTKFLYAKYLKLFFLSVLLFNIKYLSFL